MIPSLTILGMGSVGGLPHEAALPKLDLSLLERTLRRGLSEVTRLFMHAAQAALTDARTDAAAVHVIFASAYGEIATAEALLAEAYDADGSSPARFRHSVHNTTTGLLSISAQNHLPCTAIAAGSNTVAMALLEAAAQLATGAERVLLVLAEERVPAALSEDDPHEPLAVALVLGLTSGVRCTRARLSNLRQGTCTGGLPLPLPFHPLGPAVGLVEALTQHRSGTLSVGDGENPWCVDVHHPEPP
jgi:hypothetical protein